MQTTYLQRLMAFTSAEINAITEIIGMLKDEAKYWKECGETAFKINAYKQMDSLRVSLDKMVETQRALKAELRHNSDIESLKSSNTYMLTHGLSIAIGGDITTRERAQIFRAYVKSHKLALRLEARSTSIANLHQPVPVQPAC